MYSIKFAAKLVNIKELRNRIVEKLSIFIVLSTYYLTFRVVCQYCVSNMSVLCQYDGYENFDNYL